MDIESVKSLAVTTFNEYRWEILIAVVLILTINLLYRHRFYYEKKDHICSRSEQKFFKLLLSLLPKQYYIHCQTSLISLLKPADLRSARMIWAKRMDYVITDRDCKILLVIELDDKSHQRKDRKKRDKFVNKLLRRKHPLLRISHENSGDPRFIRAEIEKRISQM